MKVILYASNVIMSFTEEMLLDFFISQNFTEKEIQQCLEYFEGVGEYEFCQKILNCKDKLIN
jgi:hypothetical protein